MIWLHVISYFCGNTHDYKNKVHLGSDTLLLSQFFFLKLFFWGWGRWVFGMCGCVYIYISQFIVGLLLTFDKLQTEKRKYLTCCWFVTCKFYGFNGSSVLLGLTDKTWALHLIFFWVFVTFNSFSGWSAKAGNWCFCSGKLWEYKSSFKFKNL